MTRILAVGGGSGGHVTPVAAVFDELGSNQDYQLRFWCDYKFSDNAKKIFTKAGGQTVRVDRIASGKLRRFHGIGFWHQLSPAILLPNLRDGLLVLAGFFQSLYKLIVWRPAVIFMKGGFVCLPVGYAARLLNIPIVLHDSDAHPGLTNRLLARFAAKIATGAPLKYYSYPADKAEYIGIPVSGQFRQYSVEERLAQKKKLGFDTARPLVVITGGGLGAVRINNAVVRERQQILSQASIMLISGNDQYQDLKSIAPDQDNWRLVPFVHQGIAEILSAADVVVTRAGATTLLELAALSKPTIIIPNELLTAGHQLKNAKVYQDALAAVILSEKDMEKPGVLTQKIFQIINSPRILADMGENFNHFARPDAAKDMARMIVGAIGRGRA